MNRVLDWLALILIQKWVWIGFIALIVHVNHGWNME